MCGPQKLEQRKFMITESYRKNNMSKTLPKRNRVNKEQ